MRRVGAHALVLREGHLHPLRAVEARALADELEDIRVGAVLERVRLYLVVHLAEPRLVHGEPFGTLPHTGTTRRRSAKMRQMELRGVVLVEGLSDQAAVEALAGRRGRDLAAEGIRVVPIGGAQAIARELERFGPRGLDVELAGLCDAGEEQDFRRGLERAGLGPTPAAPASRRTASSSASTTSRTS